MTVFKNPAISTIQLCNIHVDVLWNDQNIFDLFNFDSIYFCVFKNSRVVFYPIDSFLIEDLLHLRIFLYWYSSHSLLIVLYWDWEDTDQLWDDTLIAQTYNHFHGTRCYFIWFTQIQDNFSTRTKHFDGNSSSFHNIWRKKQLCAMSKINCEIELYFVILEIWDDRIKRNMALIIM